MIATELSGQTLVDGVYVSASTTFLMSGGTLTLDGGGNADSVFIFQMASDAASFVTLANSKVTLINGAQACNVFWQVGGSATLGTGTLFEGNILADQSITDNGGSTVNGSFLARIAAVTLNDTRISRAICAAATPTSTNTPTPTSTNTPTPTSTNTPTPTSTNTPTPTATNDTHPDFYEPRLDPRLLRTRRPRRRPPRAPRRRLQRPRSPQPRSRLPRAQQRRLQPLRARRRRLQRVRQPRPQRRLPTNDVYGHSDCDFYGHTDPHPDQHPGSDWPGRQ
jgi:hypothetical protein